MPRTNKFHQYYKMYHEHVWRHRILPNFAQTRQLLKVSSLSTVYRFHQKLVEQWYLLYVDGKYHATSLLGSYEYFESIQAGFPSPATDELKSQLNLQDHLIRNPLSTILVKVAGDSMIDAGIYPDDVIIVEKGAVHHEWNIVVAVVDGDYTVKYLAKNSIWYYLKPANPNYPDIIPSEKLEIFGVVVGSFRTYL